MVRINIKISGSENIIAKLRNSDRCVKEPLADMITEGTSVLENATYSAAAVDTGNLRGAVTSKVEQQFYGMVYLGSSVPYATFNAWGAPGHNMLARHAEGGQTVAEGYGFVNYAFNTSMRRIFGMVYKKMLPEIARRLRE